ncbi:MAG: 8-amino-7-oxononanoate synthase, partial [Flavobacterium sp.]
MNTTYSFQIYKSASLLPQEWNSLAVNNIFLTREYLEVLENSCPVNMICHFIAIFNENKLIGIVL